MKRIILRLCAYSIAICAMVAFSSCSKKARGMATGHSDMQAVDLGLSVKWASCNLGASSPMEDGVYFAWGETTDKKQYSWDNYRFYKKSAAEKERGFTKYCSDKHGSNGLRDRKMTLENADDAAHVRLGGNWRIPTSDEIVELKEKCKWEWFVDKNKACGYKVTGPNGNSIFLPASGYRHGASVNNKGNDGNYWSSSLHSGSSYGVYSLNFDSECIEIYYGRRDQGRVVRPVCDDRIRMISF